MKLKSLLENIAILQLEGSTDADVDAIACDSRRVRPGTVFVAIKGEKSDGGQFIAMAVAAGAVAIVTEDDADTGEAAKVRVANARHALADLAANFYQFPSRNLKVIGVTGTNGKTTTAFLIKHICEQAMHRCGLIGTVRYEFGDRILPAARTTPESLEVQNLLWQMRSAGCKAVAMEVFSHALEQDTGPRR